MSFSIIPAFVYSLPTHTNPHLRFPSDWPCKARHDHVIACGHKPLSTKKTMADRFASVFPISFHDGFHRHQQKLIFKQYGQWSCLLLICTPPTYFSYSTTALPSQNKFGLFTTPPAIGATTVKNDFLLWKPIFREMNCEQAPKSHSPGRNQFHRYAFLYRVQKYNSFM